MKLPPTSITKTGFTLIEIIIGISIIAIVSTLGLTGWKSFSRYQVEADFNNLETTFRSERANAPLDFPSPKTATTVERIINGQKRVFYITEFGAILDHLPWEVFSRSK